MSEPWEDDVVRIQRDKQQSIIGLSGPVVMTPRLVACLICFNGEELNVALTRVPCKGEEIQLQLYGELKTVEVWEVLHLPLNPDVNAQLDCVVSRR